jgi:tetratricopeptide (TPR) repeat protein
MPSKRCACRASWQSFESLWRNLAQGYASPLRLDRLPPVNDPELQEILDRASANPQDLRAAMAAAYACDRRGLEHDAIVHYERAWQLGVPAAERPGFLVGFGSTLRNVGRAEDAVARLTEATAEYPDDAALRAFLALALHSTGQSSLALATMLEAALTAARPDGFGRYQRALREYQRELLDAPAR